MQSQLSQSIPIYQQSSQIVQIENNYDNGYDMIWKRRYV